MFFSEGWDEFPRLSHSLNIFTVPFPRCFVHTIEICCFHKLVNGLYYIYSGFVMGLLMLNVNLVLAMFLFHL